jgi:tetratricopeptide (TPR) repeat protein
MGQIEKTVFLSYRRTNFPWARAIYENLTQQGYDVFMDFTRIASGDFESVILANLKARAHFIVLLTPSALERCVDSADWLRREIEAALETRRNIVPLMLEGFDFRTPSISDQLTGNIAPLSRYNALRVPADYFDAAMDRLRGEYLNVPLDTVLHPLSVVARKSAQSQQAAGAIAPPVRPSELTAQEWLERALDSFDHPEEGIRCLSEAIRINPDDVFAFSVRANLRAQKGDLDGAIEDYSEVIRLEPDSGAFTSRGDNREKKGDLDGAMEDYNQAIRIKPDDARAFSSRAYLRQKRGDSDGAFEDYSEAIRLKPNADNFITRARAREENGDLRGAIEDSTEAIRLDPNNKAFSFRASLREKRGDSDGAIEDYSQAIRLRPDDAYAFSYRANLREKRGDLDGAMEDYNQAIRINPDAVFAFSCRASLREKSGDLDGAIEDYSQVIRLDPQSGFAFECRGDARAAKGDLDGADRDYEEAERLEGN